MEELRYPIGSFESRQCSLTCEESAQMIDAIEAHPVNMRAAVLMLMVVLGSCHGIWPADSFGDGRVGLLAPTLKIASPSSSQPRHLTDGRAGVPFAP